MIERGRDSSGSFNFEACSNELFDALGEAENKAEARAEALASLLRHCFRGEEFASVYRDADHTTALRKSGFNEACIRAVITAVEPFILTAQDGMMRSPVRYAPQAGSVTMCNFDFLRPPEMQKVRRVIIISPRPRGKATRLVVVPVSMSPTVSPVHHRFSPGTYPFFHSSEPCWAICDHPSTVALDRLWFVNVGRAPDLHARISAVDLDHVRTLVKVALGLP